MITNHCNFKNFITTKILSRKKIKWQNELSHFNFFIEYRLEVKNSMDDFFKRFDYKSKKKRFVTEEITKFDHILDIKKITLCVVYDETADKKSFKSLSIKFVILQTKKICQFFLIQKSLIVAKMRKTKLST